uniref:Wall-associated receptor kinase galacturonan-binding domain-containing protein n=2 Tax=Aegilops tauschii subsp. strangulata TaxID=200361 RepID=A0A453GZD3_AEGTS
AELRQLKLANFSDRSIYLRSAVMLTSRCVFITAVLQLLISFLAVAGEPQIGLPGCQTRCGDVSVSYPFGMGPKKCYWPGLKLTCDDRGSKPPRLLLGDGGAGAFEVVEISLEKLTMRVVSHKLQAININMSSGGSGRLSLGYTYTEAIGGAPYFLQHLANEMILTGCNVQATLRWKGEIVNRCASFCPIFTDDNGSPLPAQYFAADYNSNSCSNLGCCQSSILSSSTSYDAKISMCVIRKKNMAASAIVSDCPDMLAAGAHKEPMATTPYPGAVSQTQTQVTWP